MAYHFRLTRKGELKPADFAAIDEDICSHLGVECDANLFYASWYDTIGLSIALGSELGGDQLRERVKAYRDDRLDAILVYLEANYESWVGMAAYLPPV